MRLDKFLFFTRLTKTRSLAKRVICAGHVRINGKPVSNSHPEILVGHVVTLPLHDHIRVIQVEAIPVRRGPTAEAQQCYRDLNQKAD